MQMEKKPPKGEGQAQQQNGHVPPAPASDDVTPQEFYREFACRPDVRAILERLAK